MHEIERKEPQPTLSLWRRISAAVSPSTRRDRRWTRAGSTSSMIWNGKSSAFTNAKRCRRQDVFQSGGTRVGFQTQKPRGAFGISQAGLQFPAGLTGQDISNPRKQGFNGIMPCPANQPFHDLVRRYEKSLSSAFEIPKLDLIFDLPEGSPKHGSQFVRKTCRSRSVARRIPKCRKIAARCLREVT